jgi:RND family efflux transporter MFP subunit
MTSKIRRRRLVATSIVAGALVVLVALIALRPRPERIQPRTPAPLVVTQTVSGEQPPITVVGWGTVEPRSSISLVPQVGGQVLAVSPRLRVGAFFEAGEVLLEIESTDYELAVQQARSQVAQAEFALATAQEEARVARQEWERTTRDALEDSELKTSEPNPLVYREPQLRQAEVGLEAARAALAQAELNLERCTLVAPFAGRVLEESVDRGQYVRAGEVLARLYDIAVAEIVVELPDRDLAWISVPQTPASTVTGSQARVTGSFAGREHHWSGRAVRVGGAMDRASRTVPVVVEVADPYRSEDGQPPLLSGMFVSVSFTSEPPEGSVTIPRRALRPDDRVWVLDAEDRLEIRTVEVARSGVENAVILSGLAVGDRVITSNLQAVVAGMQLRPAEKDDGPAPADVAGTGGGEAR